MLVVIAVCGAGVPAKAALAVPFVGSVGAAAGSAGEFGPPIGMAYVTYL